MVWLAAIHARDLQCESSPRSPVHHQWSAQTGSKLRWTWPGRLRDSRSDPRATRCGHRIESVGATTPSCRARYAGQQDFSEAAGQCQMHIPFVDESGTPPSADKPKNKYFVIGGVIIPEDQWHSVRDALMGMKVRRRVSASNWPTWSPERSGGGSSAAMIVGIKSPSLPSEDRRRELRTATAWSGFRRKAGFRRRRVRP